MKLRALILRQVIGIMGTLEEAARVAGCSRSSMSLYARGERDIPASLFMRLVDHAETLAATCPVQSVIDQDRECWEARAAAMRGEQNGVLGKEVSEAMTSLVHLYYSHHQGAA